MAGRRPGELQHDFARPNRRAEGPPDHVLDMAVEAAGGRPDEWYVGAPAQPLDPGGERRPADPRAMFSTPTM
jgi:hypothetical protein